MRRIFGIGLFVIGVMASVFGVVQGIDWLTDDPEAERQQLVEEFDALLQKRLDARLRAHGLAGLQTSEQDDGLRQDLRGAAKTLQDAGAEGREAVRQLIEDGKTDEARALLQRLAGADAKAGAQANARAAERYRQIGALAFLDDTKAAMDAYSKAVELDPDYPHGWNELGRLQHRSGKLQAAIRSYERALALVV